MLAGSGKGKSAGARDWTLWRGNARKTKMGDSTQTKRIAVGKNLGESLCLGSKARPESDVTIKTERMGDHTLRGFRASLKTRAGKSSLITFSKRYKKSQHKKNT